MPRPGCVERRLSLRCPAYPVVASHFARCPRHRCFDPRAMSAAPALSGAGLSPAIDTHRLRRGQIAYVPLADP